MERWFRVLAQLYLRRPLEAHFQLGCFMMIILNMFCDIPAYIRLALLLGIILHLLFCRHLS